MESLMSVILRAQCLQSLSQLTRQHLRETKLNLPYYGSVYYEYLNILILKINMYESGQVSYSQFSPVSLLNTLVKYHSFISN